MARELARIMTQLTGKPWAITQGGLDELVSLAARQTPSFEALARRAARRSSDDDGDPDPEAADDGPHRAALAEGDDYLRDSGNAVVRQGVAIIRIFGPLVAYASWLEDLCGITSYESIRKDLLAAVSHPAVVAVLLEIDSPGGQVTGCSDTAAAIRAASEHLPVVAYVAGDACSAALWLAVAAEHVSVTPTAGVGSLGCCCSILDRREQEAKQGIKTWEIISSQTPGKRPDVATDAGKAAIQKVADDTAAVFIAEVARYRGLSVDHVSSPACGQGAVLIGQVAIDAGLADEITTFEETFAELAPEGDDEGETAPSALLPAFA